MTFILVVVLFLYVWHLSGKIQRLSSQVSRQEEELTSLKLGAPVAKHSGERVQLESRPLSEMPAPPAPVSSGAAAPRLSAQPDGFQQLLKWLSTDWLLKLGAALVLLGIGWFVSYAFAENWIGPVGRVSLGLVVGTALLVFGELRGRKHAQQGTVLLVLGAATILLTTYAARAVYDFFTPISATGLMLTAVVFIAVSSVRYRKLDRAALGFFLAVLIPFMTASADPSALGLISYLFMVVAGTLWIVSLTGWRELFTLSSVVYLLYSFIAFNFAKENDGWLLLLTMGFALLFYAVNMVLHFKMQAVRKLDFLAPLVNAFTLALWFTILVPDHLRSIALSGVALLFFVGAYLLYQRSKQTLVVLEYAGISLALLAAAAAFEFDGPALVIAHSLLVTTALLLSWLVTKKVTVSLQAGLLYVPVLMELYVLWEDVVRLRQRAELAVLSLGNTRYAQELSRELAGEQNMLSKIRTLEIEFIVVLGILLLQIAAVGYFSYRNSRKLQEKKHEAENWAALYLIGAVALGLYWIWFTLESMLQSVDSAHLFALVVWTVAGLSAYVYGRLHRRKKTLFTGIGILAVVVLRLMFVELWTMELFERVIAFLLIGALLMGAAFIKPAAESGAEVVRKE